MDAGERWYARVWLWRCHLSAAGGRQHTCTLLVSDAWRAIWLPRHPQRVDLDCGLFHRARWPEGRVSPDLPLRLSSGQRRRAVTARDVRRGGQDAAEMAYSG